MGGRGRQSISTLSGIVLGPRGGESWGGAAVISDLPNPYDDPWVCLVWCPSCRKIDGGSQRASASGTGWCPRETAREERQGKDEAESCRLAAVSRAVGC